jgi:hypothetical protein
MRRSSAPPAIAGEGTVPDIQARPEDLTVPRFLPIAAAAAAAFVGVRLVRREWQRINADLDRVRGKQTPPVETLRRDEITGEWRPSR